MDDVSNKKNKLIPLLFLTSFFFVFISYDFYHVRVSDLMLLAITPVIFFRSFRKSLFFFSFLFLSIFVFSDLITLYCGGGSLGTDVIFYYKYITIFIIFFATTIMFSERNYFYFYAKAFVFLMCVLVLWVIYSKWFSGGAYLDSNGRPSFPFSRDFRTSDAHLYSAILGLGFIFYYLYCRRYLKYYVVYDVFFFFTFPISLLATGSRSGIAAVLFFSAFFCFLLFVRFIFSFKLRRNYLVILFLSFVLALIVFNFLVSYGGVYRALNFNFLSDESSSIRYLFLLSAIETASENGYLFGAGILGSSGYFYDGIISILVAHGGFLAFSVFVFMISYYVFLSFGLCSVSFYSRALLVSFVLSFVFLNIITEYIYVTRGAIPMISMVVFSWYHTKNNSKILLI
ncbi:hypothetical protein [Halomonas sp. Mc5H-6]|uniref:hypothetical protein n=1 Tax=Halomonas sp. Mc5H-6 TaxID=2954500 RepID=UPI002096F0AB|nr:hypothetical protein [Halomonas sp. Mc5H-6]MCO7246804.1 hypothetical protein [Halomonas sp. Mc5H-6]